LTFKGISFNVEHMNEELFQAESIADILEDIATFRGDYRFGLSQSRFERGREEEEEDQENIEFDHFSFDK